MFLLPATLIALQWGRWIPTVPIVTRRWPTWPIFGFVAVAGSVVLIVNRKMFGGIPFIFKTLLIISVLGVVIDTVFSRRVLRIRWSALAGVSNIVAYIIWRMDRAGQFTAPESWLQGHAIWHVLNAVALGCVAIFYRSEASVATTSARDQSSPKVNSQIEDDD